MLDIPFHPPLFPRDVLQIALRFVHYAAGIVWVGMLYFLTLVHARFLREAPGDWKPQLFRTLTLPALNWFRWAAVATVFVGIWYWMILVGNNVRAAQSMSFAGVSGGRAIGSFFLIWTLLWALEFGLLNSKAAANGVVVAIIMAVLIAAASYSYLALNDQPWIANNVLSIGVGGGMGWFMLLNVWGIIWRHNKKIIRGTLAGAAPPNAANLARQAFLASRVNFFLSFPMLFFMAAATHYPMLGR